VTEELKLYVAHKAETNFVDVVPQAKQLRLPHALPAITTHDLCKDVSGLAVGEMEMSKSD
jgi:predicted transport protein